VTVQKVFSIRPIEEAVPNFICLLSHKHAAKELRDPEARRKWDGKGEI